MELENKPLSEAISSVEPVTEKVEDKPKKNKIFLITVSILLLLIAVVGGYYVYTKYYSLNLVELPSTIDDVSEDEIEYPVKEEDEVVKEVEEEKEEYEMKNKGWALFSLPEYGFSAEIPTYIMQDGVEGVDVKWFWTTEARTSEWVLLGLDPLLPNYIETVYIKFDPDREDLFGCDEGCAQTHFFMIDIFKNSNKKKLTEIRDEYFASLKENSEDTLKIEDQLIEKWSYQIVSFKETFPQEYGGVDYYIVVNEDYIYVISAFQSKTPVESYEISQKVLDSFEFGE